MNGWKKKSWKKPIWPIMSFSIIPQPTLEKCHGAFILPWCLVTIYASKISLFSIAYPSICWSLPHEMTYVVFPHAVSNFFFWAETFVKLNYNFLQTYAVLPHKVSVELFAEYFLCIFFSLGGHLYRKQSKQSTIANYRFTPTIKLYYT